MKLTLQMVLVLGLITLLSGLFLSTLNRWAEPRIEEHRRERIVTAINQLYPGDPAHQQIATYADQQPIYICYDETGDTLGYAFQARGSGYSDEIRLMIGLTPELDNLTGIFVLEQTETPGLGARIAEEDFRESFAELSLDSETPDIRLVQQNPEKTEVAAITGATISSKSVVRIINRSRPQVKRVLQDFGKGGKIE